MNVNIPIIYLNLYIIFSSLQAELALAQEELIKETQMHCDKLNILGILTEEKTFLEKLLLNQEKNYQKWLKPPSLSVDKDIEKLMVIETEQKEQIKVSSRPFFQVSSINIKLISLCLIPF